MPFEAKTLEELVETEKDEYRAHIRDEDGNGPDLSEGSDYDIEARVHATAVFGNEAHASYLAKQILPDTAERAMLDRHANLRGVTKRSATAASGRVHIGLDGGVAPLTQDAGSIITALDGRTYELDEDAIVQLPTWGAKTTRLGATLTRVQVSPDVTGMERGQRCSIDGIERTIVRVLPSIQAIEVDPPFAAAPSDGISITAVASAFAAVTAQATGKDGSQEPGTTGTLSGPTAGIGSSVEFVEMTGGADDETPDELRRDVLSVMAVHPGSGNLEQFRRWALDTPGVGLAEAFVYPNLRGLGTMTIVPMGATGVRQIGEERNAEVLAYIRQQCSGFDDVEVLQFSWHGTPQEYRLTVEPRKGYEPDVDMDGAALDLSGSIASTTSQLQLAVEADLDRFQIGDRVWVPIAVDGFPTMQEAKINGIQDAGVGDYRLALESALLAAPALGEQLYSGGPLYGAIVDALAAYHETLGPGDTSPASRWPGGDTYSSDIIRTEIIRTVKTLAGVRDLSVDTPSANVITPPLFVRRLGQVRIIWS